eukprot:scaffold36934_cov61-Phaeocystis_antarctica.AAC.3
MRGAPPATTGLPLPGLQLLTHRRLMRGATPATVRAGGCSGARLSRTAAAAGHASDTVAASDTRSLRRLLKGLQPPASTRAAASTTGVAA